MQGVCALSAASYLALPSKAGTGRLRVSNALEGSNVLAELEAHKSAVVSIKSGEKTFFHSHQRCQIVTTVLLRGGLRFEQPPEPKLKIKRRFLVNKHGSRRVGQEVESKHGDSRKRTLSIPTRTFSAGRAGLES